MASRRRGLAAKAQGIVVAGEFWVGKVIIHSFILALNLDVVRVPNGRKG
jgi:hypothetical protein